MVFFCVINDIVSTFSNSTKVGSSGAPHEEIHQFSESGADPPIWWSRPLVELKVFGKLFWI
jgi:hypothetical protein